MQDEFLVHRREGEPCPRCGTPIRRILVSGRSTYFCPGCQVRLRRRPRRRRRAAAARTRDERAAPVPEGFSVGHWSDAEARTGCTAVIAPPGSRGGVDVRGGGPGTRETDVVGPLAGSHEVTAVVLSGGSAFGLAAADGAVRWLEEHGRGYPTPGGLVPIVPAAVVYDLIGGDASVRPGPEQGYAACEAAVPGVPERGAVGAGTGTAVAKLFGRERATAAGVGYAAATQRPRRDGRRAGGRERVRRRDRRGRRAARRARATRTERCARRPRRSPPWRARRIGPRSRSATRRWSA